jgi:hypothetical protein
MNPKHQAETLREIASRVDRNLPRHGNPEAFHSEKSEISHDLRQMAKRLERNQDAHR